ncbi:hypothetical protein ACLVWQ_00950 [Streptomyces sp. CWNU-52B]|uniref:hypothetical protein n=1 Tax=unclassified Streptomyces TaxID=2593676 RepID=UPI0039BF4316
MRALPVRRLATSALCATFLLGIAGPVAVAAGHDSAPGARAVTAQAPVPDADALLAQTQSLGSVAGVLRPVTDLLAAVLKADNGQLPAADSAKLADAVKEAVAKATAAAPAAPAVPQAPPQTLPSTTPNKPNEPKAPGTPSGPVAPPSTLPALPGAPALPAPQDDAEPVAAPDLRADALKALQGSVDALVEAASGGDAAAVKTASTAVVTKAVNFVAAVAVGGGLPAPTLPGLPGLPS